MRFAQPLGAGDTRSVGPCDRLPTLSCALALSVLLLQCRQRGRLGPVPGSEHRRRVIWVCRARRDPHGHSITAPAVLVSNVLLSPYWTPVPSSSWPGFE